MTPKDIVENFADRATLLAALSDDEIGDLNKRLPGPIPRKIIDLLRYTAGLDLPPNLSARFRRGDGKVRFNGVPGFEYLQAFPFSTALLNDGSGNFWVADIDARDGAWGAIFYSSHDPPVISLQAPDLAEFLLQLVAPDESPEGDPVAYILNDAVPQIWRDDPWLRSVEEVRSLSDPILSAFADRLPLSYRIADLRKKQIGSGFSWGRSHADAEIRRDGTELIFAVGQGGSSN